MRDPPAAAPAQHGLQTPKKRPRRLQSDSPSQEPPEKKPLLEQEWYHMTEELTTMSDSLSFTAVLDYLNACESPALTDQIDDWLEETHPSDIPYSNSDNIIQNTRQIPRTSYAQSAPPSMPRRKVPAKKVRFSRRVSIARTTSAASSCGQRNGTLTEPSITGTVSPGATSPRTTGSLVENPQYESLNLAANNIFHRDRREQLPEHISQLVQKISTDREVLDISVQDIDADDALADLERGAGEPGVEQYIQNTLVTLPPRNDILKRSDKIPMSRRTIPNTGTAYRVSGPVPDILLGYNFAVAFNPVQRMKLASMNLDSANRDGLCLPFLIIELKGDGPSSNGSL
ncbi:hypothetical protein FPOA_07078 [Fusarium poae]|uniref:Uncharacterized protein n=1 Tax=Fusarium poae TaxID=36050 RepID=A0A1B8AJL0_FUSPO|nr:hypothetical protein FPOA_07078 [Fusarium poae]